MNKIVVVDLDGCLCSLNSFRYWLVFSFLFLFISFRWFALIKFIKVVLLRFFHKLNRVQMKRDILELTENIPHLFISWFCQFLYFFTNSDVYTEMRRYENMHLPVVLCTAAPACYVSVFSKKFRFSHVFSSPPVFEGAWIENIGECKWRSISAYYGKDVILECVITDHHDDLPLLLRAKKRVLVKPSKDTLDKVKGRFEFDLL